MKTERHSGRERERREGQVARSMLLHGALRQTDRYTDRQMDRKIDRYIDR